MTDLTGDEAIDRELLIGELEAARFAETELREDAWNPLEWVYLIGDGLFTLNAREFAPLADRLASTAGRLEGLPAVIEAATTTLVGAPGRPVGRFQTETALKQLPGIDELIAEALDCRRGGRADRSGRRGPAAPPDRRGRYGTRRDRRLRATPERGRPARPAEARAGWARSCSRPRCATPCARRR